jgi:DNA-binding transcriptional ArsR family regulator
MVEYTYNLDFVFGSLADQTRRKIVSLISRHSMTVGQIAQHFELTYGAISKHILVLERAKVITKQRKGKEQFVSLSPVAIEQAEACLEAYRHIWEARMDSLAEFVANKKEK